MAWYVLPKLYGTMSKSLANSWHQKCSDYDRNAAHWTGSYIRCVEHCHALEDLFLMLFLHICHFFTWTVSTCNMLVGRHWSSLCARHTDGPMTLICYHDGCAMSNCVNVGANVTIIMLSRKCGEHMSHVSVCDAGCMLWWLSSNSNVELNVRGGLGTP